MLIACFNSKVKDNSISKSCLWGINIIFNTFGEKKTVQDVVMKSMQNVRFDCLKKTGKGKPKRVQRMKMTMPCLCTSDISKVEYTS